MPDLELNSIAIAISVLSLLVAAFSLGWNVYRDVILKPRLKVQVSIVDLVGDGVREGAFVNVSGTNHGPGDINVSMTHGEVAPLWRRVLRRTRKFIVQNAFDNPNSGQLPTHLSVGEKVDLLFDYNEECFLVAQPTHVGLRDSFGRIHWASRREVARATAQFAKDFPSEETE